MPARRQLSHNHTLGIGRREVLQVGYSGLLGAGLPAILSQQAQAAKAKGSTTDQPKRPKSVLIVFLTGAPSHHDTFDMKPDAPVEIRGEFK
ncbi:MAG: DUF1501 domain-containing protein, partial [Planctomycetaceae bacterium]|nr:DUF1501 domain-containing protein [Planctomycetaceae bacterium]